jgi:hypothetical protein
VKTGTKGRDSVIWACHCAAPGLPFCAPLIARSLRDGRAEPSPPRLPGRESECRGSQACAAASGYALLTPPARLPLGQGLHPAMQLGATRPARSGEKPPSPQSRIQELLQSRKLSRAILSRSLAAWWATRCAGRSRRGSASVGQSRLNSEARHRTWPAIAGGRCFVSVTLRRFDVVMVCLLKAWTMHGCG